MKFLTFSSQRIVFLFSSKLAKKNEFYGPAGLKLPKNAFFGFEPIIGMNVDKGGCNYRLQHQRIANKINAITYCHLLVLFLF